MTIDSSHCLKIAKIQGSFIWHSHPDTDEVFYCVSGGPVRLEICTKATSPEQAEQLGVEHMVELKMGDMFKVPRGVQHRPIADAETGILMIERVGTVNTGDREGHELTALLKGSEV
jgi:mannose-6-phosphate isomerase-like protein (cupin superfamily)